MSNNKTCKYEDLLEHICHERHITLTADKEGNYHFYPYHRNKRTDLEMRRSIHKRKACVQGTALTVGDNHVNWPNMQYNFFDHFTWLSFLRTRLTSNFCAMVHLLLMLKCWRPIIQPQHFPLHFPSAPSLALVLAPFISPGQESNTSIWSYDSYDSEDCVDHVDSDDTTVTDSDDDSVQVIKVSPSPKLEIVSHGLTKCRNSVPVIFFNYSYLVKTIGRMKLPRLKRILNMAHLCVMSWAMSTLIKDASSLQCQGLRAIWLRRLGGWSYQGWKGSFLNMEPPFAIKEKRL